MSDEMRPPEGGADQGTPMAPEVPEPFVPPVPGPPAPPAPPEVVGGSSWDVVHPSLEAAAPPPRRRLHWGFALLGFVTPWIAGVLQGFLLNAIAMASPVIGGQFIGGLASFFNVALVVMMIVAWVAGRSQGKNGLRSFGIGGLASYATVMLIALLAFGACMITM